MLGSSLLLPLLLFEISLFSDLFSLLFIVLSVLAFCLRWSHLAFLSAPGTYSAWSGRLGLLQQ